MSVAGKIKAKGIKTNNKDSKPVWKGPEEDGITQSLLSRFLVCRERFRLRVVEGLRPAEGFNHRLEYGQMWHICEEAHAANTTYDKPLLTYCKELSANYPLARSDISKWYNICKRQFPEYVKYWKKHPDVKKRRPISQEQTFKVPIKLPSGRIVSLRGKFDSIDVIGAGRSAGTFLQENKTKGQINEVAIQTQLQFDLQTMLYLTAMKETLKLVKGLPPIKGVRYNVIRRPLSGGKGTIKQKKPTKANPRGEDIDAYYDRLAQYFIDEPEEWFIRWKVEITDAEIELFKSRCLFPILEQLCDWWEVIKESPFDPWNNPKCSEVHWIHPYGVYNVLNEGGTSDVDDCVFTGNKVGLVKTDNLFPEL